MSTLLSLVESRVKQNLEGVLFEYKSPFSISALMQAQTGENASESESLWHSVSGAKALEQIDRVAVALYQKGVRKGDFVMLLARSTYFTVLVEFACYRLGVAIVPVYETSSSAQIASILDESPAKCVYAPSAKYAQNVPGGVIQISDEDILKALEGEVDQAVVKVVQKYARDSVKPQDVAAVMHTVNAKGKPIAVRYTHEDFMKNVEVAKTHIEEGGTDTRRYLSFLSFAHIAPKIFMYIALASGSTIGITPGVRNVLSDLQHFTPSYMMSVPRVYDRIYTDLVDSAPLSIFGAFFRRSLKRTFTSEPDFSFAEKIRTLLGGQLSATFTTSIKPDPSLMRFFQNVGVGAYDFYTVTEARGIIAMSTPLNNKPGCAGQILSGNKVRLDTNGQLVVNKVHTGDIGEIDDEGFLSIKGREKEVITISSGRNVLPEPMQQSLATHPMIAEALVIGENRPYITALLSLDETHVNKVLDENGVEPDSVEAAILLDKLVEKAVDATNKTVSRGEQIRQYAILEDGFGKFADLYTGSLRLKRNAVCKYYKDLINEVLYAK
jgi:long-chain acyl-CoA synthetase